MQSRILAITSVCLVSLTVGATLFLLRKGSSHIDLSAKVPSTVPATATNNSRGGVPDMPDTAIPTPAPAKNLYNGKLRSTEWLDAMYAEHGAEVVQADGKYYEIGAALSGGAIWLNETGMVTSPTDVAEHKAAQGTYLATLFALKVGGLYQCNGGKNLAGASYPWKVLNIINDHEIRATVDGDYGFSLVIHVSGIDARTFVDGQPFETGAGRPCQGLIYVGPCRLGASTYESYAAYRPVTRQEFADALSAGIILHTYTTKTVAVPPDPATNSAATQKIIVRGTPVE